jgi:hypothetical protein
MENNRNVIERHPMYTLFGTVLATMTITWAVLTFVLDDNKVNLYKAHIESINAQIENVKSENSIYLAKIDYLESENKKLEELNNFYLDWISNSAASLPALKVQLKTLAEENNKLKEHQGSKINLHQADTTEFKSIDNNNLKKYIVNQRIQKSRAYRDDVTEIVIGVKDINVLGEAALQITFPDNSTKEEKVGAGKTFNYSNKSKQYQVIVNRIEYIYDYVEVQIVEKK